MASKTRRRRKSILLRRKRRRTIKQNVRFAEPMFDKLDLQNSNLNLDKDTTVVGILYADWCPHCKEMIPADKKTTGKWDETLRLIEQRAPNTRVRHIQLEEANMEKDLPLLNARYKVDLNTEGGYPTIFKIRNGVAHKFDREREPNAIAGWVAE
jgi:thiol-disulfide isomerase/thioredoxin